MKNLTGMIALSFLIATATAKPACAELITTSAQAFIEKQDRGIAKWTNNGTTCHLQSGTSIADDDKIVALVIHSNNGKRCPNKITVNVKFISQAFHGDVNPDVRIEYFNKDHKMAYLTLPWDKVGHEGDKVVLDFEKLLPADAWKKESQYVAIGGKEQDRGKGKTNAWLDIDVSNVVAYYDKAEDKAHLNLDVKALSNWRGSEMEFKSMRSILQDLNGKPR